MTNKDEDYIDGIKLPTDKDMPIWEVVNPKEGTLYKMKINEGYLYLKYPMVSGSTPTMCFVSNEKRSISETDTSILLNKVAELSMKINKMQSDLREFEKQKVEPLKERTDLANECFAKLDNKFSARMEEIENYLSSHRPVERIERLEKYHTRQLEEYSNNAQHNYEIVHANQQKLDERIQKLEEKNKGPFTSFSVLENTVIDNVKKINELFFNINTTKIENGEIFKEINRLNNLMIELTDYTKSINDLRHRIEKLEEHHIRQIDENRKSFVRIDSYEERIEKLESFFTGFYKTTEQMQCGDPEKQECEHDWDSYLLLSNPPKIQCKKCKFTKTFENYFMTAEFQHPRDKLQLCKHGVPVKTCTACY